MFNNLALCMMAILFIGCAADPTKNADPTEVDEAETPISKRIYFFQHKVISKWVFDSEGAFYSDLKQGHYERLRFTAEDIVSAEYAKEISFSQIENQEAVLIVFPKPDAPPNCYYAIVQKIEDGFRYITYESTLDIMNSGFYGVVGGWDSEGQHHNYGPRTYRSSSQFVSDVLGSASPALEPAISSSFDNDQQDSSNLH